MKVLVTGGGGFLGRYIVEKLLGAGHEVTSFSRRRYLELEKIGAKTITGDICDREAISLAINGMDGVIHTASRVGVWGPWNEFYRANVIGTRNVIDACRKNGVGRLVYTSSPSVVFDGADHEGIDESYPYPDNYLAYYPHTKAMAEREVINANGKRGLATCSLRPHLVWGPRDTNLIPRLVSRARSGRLKLVGNGHNLIDTVYVENAATAHVNALERLEEGSLVAGSVYFISQGEPVKIGHFINEVLDRYDLPPASKSVSFKTAYMVGSILEFMYQLIGKQDEPIMTRFLALQLSKSHYFDISKARTELGYYPSITIREGLGRLALIIHE